MKGLFRLSIVAAAAASLAAGMLASSSAQSPQQDKMYRPAEATIYRDAAYRGPAVFIGEQKSNLGLAWPVNSVRVASGTWELCEKPRFRGTRSEERRVGTEGVSTCRSRWSPDH